MLETSSLPGFYFQASVRTVFPRSEPALEYKLVLIITLANVHFNINKSHPRIQVAVLIKTPATCFDKKPHCEYFVTIYLAILITH